jgi:hypothetical protein
MVMDEKPKSFIIVQFADVGSANMVNAQFEGVTPLQVLAFSEYLQLIGKQKLLTELQEREAQMAEQKLAVPENKIITAHR